jgi:hypothetical protein
MDSPWTAERIGWLPYFIIILIIAQAKLLMLLDIAYLPTWEAPFF